MSPGSINPNVKRVRIVVVDDHPLVRQSVALFMAKEDDLEVVASCEDADQCLAVVRDLTPDVVLMDIEMPGTSAFQVARALARTGSAARFVFLSAFLTDSYLQEAMTLGVSGYLVKSADIEEISRAVREVAGGKSYYGPMVQERLGALESTSRIGRLTGREREVLQLVASDLSCKEIAVRLGLSVRTVDRHKANIMEKVGIHSQVGLTRFAVAEGVCNPRTGQ